jgi:DNA-directed RNA polymerase specialized sigma24 family protein
MAGESTTAIIPAIKQGDHEAIERLWIRYFDKLVAAARRRLGSARRRSYDEEDVAVSVFWSLCRGAERGNFTKLSDRDDLWALLLALTRQKAVDRIRHEMREKRGGGNVRGESIFAKGDLGSGAFGLENLVADEPTPKTLVDLEEQHKHLMQILPNDMMRQIAMQRMDGHSAKEIAAEFGYTTRWAQRKLDLIRKKWLRELNKFDSS